MRLGIVRGHVTLNPAVAAYRGRTLVVLEPVTMANLHAGNGLGGGKSLVAVDELGAANGQVVAFTEGREAANPFWPDAVPADAYCALIVDAIDIHAK
jgi:ethanolamine utilization protein EutN